METSNSAVRADSLTSFYLAALDLLEASGIPFLVGGTFAYARYTAIDRETKDLDLVVLPADLPRTLSRIPGGRISDRGPVPALAREDPGRGPRARRHLQFRQRCCPRG